MGWKGTFIENEARYEAAKARNIKLNRAKTGRARWFAAHEDAQLINDWLFCVGEFESRMSDDGSRWIRHPMANYVDGEFLSKMRDVIDNWGGLTDGQHAAVRKCYDNAVERLATREKRMAEQKAADAQTSHVGTVGDRTTFILKVERVLEFDGQYGTTYFNICRDEAGNVVLYKGSNCWSRGDTVVCKATIKAHEVRDGVPQTIISRPTVASTQLAA